ncbi:hypothetical protein [Sicyoidochytrium minutum DNA virus]|nr:hypothetical protein [Sicyoidochytrium minutum DNA virus]BDC16817.1 hypothetical protein [Sicyoidochytrium minutum DNA virus]
MKYISDQGLYQVSLVLGLFSIIFGIGSIYFVYRWGVTLLATDKSVRDVMIGAPFNQWLGSDDFLIFVASLYLGFKFVYVIVETARWEISMERMRKNIYKSQILKGDKSKKTLLRAQYDAGPKTKPFA